MEGKKCWICGAGEFTPRLFAPEKGDLVAAADGGAACLAEMGIAANRIVGDFDSLGYCPAGENVEAYAPEKDDTDLLLAVKWGLGQGCDTFYIYGALGGRLSHTVANLQVLYRLARRGKHGFLVGADSVMTVIFEERARFAASCAGLLSVFAQDGAAEGVTLRNLKYEVEKAELTGDYPLGTSNEFVGRAAEISVERGALLLIWENAAADFSKIEFEKRKNGGEPA